MTDTTQPENKPPPVAPPRPDFQALPLAQAVRFGRQHWRFISMCGLLAGLTTAVVIVLFVPRLYEATATLVIMSPNVSSELKPATLTVQGYQKLLE